MQPILSFNDLTEHLKQLHRTFRLAVVCGADASTAEAVMRAVRHEFAEAWFVGACEQVKQQTCVAQYNKEWGILPKGQVLTHIAMAQIPAYHKLLFFTDAAVIPYPTHEQRVQQVAYLARMLHAFGIEQPRVALVHCAETVSDKFPHTIGYGEICQRAAAGEWGRLLVDGPLDLRTACDIEALRVKGIHSVLGGEADALVLPDIEVANVFYKALPLFASAQVAGTLQGTLAPVVLPSRGDCVDAKYHSLALAIMSC